MLKQTQSYPFLYELVMILNMIGMLIILISVPLRLDAIYSFGTVLIIMAMFVSLLNIIFDKQIVNCLLVFLLIGFTIVGMIFAQSYNYLTILRIGTFAEFPIFMCLNRDKIDDKWKGRIYFIFSLLTILFVLLYFSPNAHKLKSRGTYWNSDYLTLGYSNPNEAAIYLMFTETILLSGVFYSKKIWAKIFLLVETVICIYFIILTECRAMEGLSILLVVGSILIRKLRCGIIVKMIFVIVPLLFMIALLIFPEMQSWEIFGEGLDSGRVNLYGDYVDHLNLFKIIFGDYPKYQFSNTHNAYLCVLASVGILPLLTYICLLIVAFLQDLNKPTRTKSVIVARLFMLIIFLHFAVEAAVMVSGSASGVLLFTVMFLGSEKVEK